MDLCDAHSSLNILFVGQDDKDSVLQLILFQHGHEFRLTYPHSVSEKKLMTGLLVNRRHVQTLVLNKDITIKLHDAVLLPLFYLELWKNGDVTDAATENHHLSKINVQNCTILTR